MFSQPIVSEELSHNISPSVIVPNSAVLSGQVRQKGSGNKRVNLESFSNTVCDSTTDPSGGPFLWRPVGIIASSRNTERSMLPCPKNDTPLVRMVTDYKVESTGEHSRRKSESDALVQELKHSIPEMNSMPVSPVLEASPVGAGCSQVTSSSHLRNLSLSSVSSPKSDASVNSQEVDATVSEDFANCDLAYQLEKESPNKSSKATNSALSPKPSPGQNVSTPCAICGDRSTGKHYGAYSCDGCKGFFRRSIRKKTSPYRCRYNQNCTMTKDMRNQCRACRLKKCISAGMRKDAVQHERDRISQRKHNAPCSENFVETAENSITLEILKAAEVTCRTEQKARESNRNPSSELDLDYTEHLSGEGRRKASVYDMLDSITQQLFVLVDWAKAIPAFNALPFEDRIMLLKSHSAEHLLLGIAWRSRYTDGHLLLGNDMIIPRLLSGIKLPHGRFEFDVETSVSNINWIASRVLDDIVKPLRKNKVDETEFTLLRAMTFFDPMLSELSDPDTIHNIRIQVQLLLEHYIAEREDVDSCARFGQIILMLPYLQSIASTMIQQLQMAKNDGFRGIDRIIQEMLLGEFGDEEEERCHVHPSLGSPIPFQRYSNLSSDSRNSRSQSPPASCERSVLHQVTDSIAPVTEVRVAAFEPVTQSSVYHANYSGHIRSERTTEHTSLRQPELSRLHKEGYLRRISERSSVMEFSLLDHNNHDRHEKWRTQNRESEFHRQLRQNEKVASSNEPCDLSNYSYISHEPSLGCEEESNANEQTTPLNLSEQ